MPRRENKGVIIISQVFDTPFTKVKITDGDDVTTEVTDFLLGWNVTLRATDTLPYANIRLDNSDGQYLDAFTKGNTVEIWADYTDGDTTRIFRGKLDNIGFNLDNNGYSAVIDARTTPELADQTIIEQFSNKLSSDAIKQIIDNSFAGVVTYTNVEDSSIPVTANYENSTGWSAIVDICKRAGLDCYIDTDYDLHVFAKDSKENKDVSAAQGINIKSVSRYGTDFDSLRNRIILYGKESNNIIYLWSEDDTDSQSDYWRIDEVISDSNIYTLAEMEQKAESTLIEKTILPVNGTISAVGMQLVNPGESIYFSVKNCGIQDKKRLKSVTHSWNTSGFTTNLEIADRPDSLTKLFKDRIDAEKALKPYNNLNDMKYSYTIAFDEAPSLCNHDDTEESGGVLKLVTGAASGVMTSDVLYLDEDVTELEFRYYGNYPQTAADTYEVSNDGGDTYKQVTAGVVTNFTAPGKKIRIKMNLTTDGGTIQPVYEGVGLLVK